ncbi:hypothetical protein IFM46972_09554 [Aspergillus udagawae]|uniref:Uncharacterized protein n=1 Tax=Aspergillus udagawae TaxID=91492 RepID=A0A8H3S798_9EURO|nr:hypothetical protein IFM46972_09554 [Aspergillus udagawae]
MIPFTRCYSRCFRTAPIYTFLLPNLYSQSIKRGAYLPELSIRSGRAIRYILLIASVRVIPNPHTEATTDYPPYRR